MSHVQNAGKFVRSIRKSTALTTFSQLSADPIEETAAPAETIDPRYEQLAWAVGKIIQQQETPASVETVQTKQ